MRYLLSLVITIVVLNPVFAQTPNEVHLLGTVKSKGTGDPIPRASIGILGTQQGTIANKEGAFNIVLESGKSYQIRIRAIGYKPDTVSIHLNSSEERSFSLEIEPIIGKEIIVSSDASRIEARRIMHEVIHRKKEWQAKLNDYNCSAYSRWNLKTLSSGDTTVQSVLESTADCFWKRNKGFSETITSRRQTANFPPQLNSFSVGDIVNFYDSRLDFNDLSLAGPVADDAFDFYDYDLKGNGLINGASVYQISVEPNILTEGFQGILWIDQTDYTIAYLDLSPSNSVKIGPLKEVHLQQTFELFENNFYLPVDLRTSVTVKLQLPLVPEFKFELLSVLQNYSVNKGLEDSLFDKKRHRIAPLADSVDTAKWASQRAIPLAKDEELAYHRIDSTVAEARKDSSGSFSLLELLSYLEIPRYNHVEGWRFGLSKEVTPNRSFPLTLNGGIAYGLDDKLWKYELGFKQGVIWSTMPQMYVSGDLNSGLTGKVVNEPVVLLSLEAKYSDDLTTRGNVYSSILNTISSLVYNNDYQEFYHEKGYTLGLDLTPGYFDLTASYTRSQVWDVMNSHIVHPDTSQFDVKSRFGSLKLALSRDMSFGDISATLKTSSKLIGSDFAFSTLELELNTKGKLGSFGVVEVTARYNDLLAGELPRWETFFFETRNGFFSHHSYFRGLAPFEFQGDEMISLNLEHNFFDLPTRLLGIHFLDFLDLHWLFHGGIGITDFTRSSPYTVASTGKTPYSEIGFGIGNIYNILQLEGTWRLTHKLTNNFYPTLEIRFSF